MKMKKTLAVILGAAVPALALSGCSSLASNPTGSYTMVTVAPMFILLALWFVFMIVPDAKKRKKTQEMRDTVEVGDKITTIGGMIGKVVHVASDRITFETGEDRVRIEVAKWAISSNDGKGLSKEAVDSNEKLDPNKQ